MTCQDITLFRPTNLFAFRALHQMNGKYAMWIIDAEFSSIRGVNSIPWSISIRDLHTDNIIVSTSVDYDLDLDDADEMMGEQSRVHSGLNNRAQWQNRSYFEKFYPGRRTSGMSLGAIGDAIRTAGFKPDTHCILSWYSSINVAIFRRAFGGGDALFSHFPARDLVWLPDSQGHNCLQPINIAYMLMLYSNAKKVSCGYSHHSLFPRQEMQMHVADKDTLPACHIYRYMVKECAEWMAEL